VTEEPGAEIAVFVGGAGRPGQTVAGEEGIELPAGVILVGVHGIGGPEVFRYAGQAGIVRRQVQERDFPGSKTGDLCRRGKEVLHRGREAEALIRHGPGQGQGGEYLGQGADFEDRLLVGKPAALQVGFPVTGKKPASLMIDPHHDPRRAFRLDQGPDKGVDPGPPLCRKDL